MKSEQMQEKIMSGDYVVLGKILGTTPETARMRFRREKTDAVEGMARIIESREKLINP